MPDSCSKTLITSLYENVGISNSLWRFCKFDFSDKFLLCVLKLNAWIINKQQNIRHNMKFYVRINYKSYCLHQFTCLIFGKSRPGVIVIK